MIYTATIEFKNYAGEDDFFEVDFEAEPEITNDSFDYGGTHCTGGRSGTCVMPDYVTLENTEIKWDKSKHSEAENTLIKKYLDEKYDDVEQEFIDRYTPHNPFD